jgi:hypothetical protein
MNVITCLIPLLSLAWDGGNAPADRRTADGLRSALSSRELQVALLSPAEQKRYDAALAGARQPQQAGQADVDKLQSARQFFKEAVIQLQFRQETKALEAEKEGLRALLDRWDAKSKWPASDLAVLQSHFEPLSKLVQQDPQLLLTFLHDLDEQYTLVRTQLKKRGAPEKSLAAVANLWLQLSHADRLSKDDWDIAVFWAPLLEPRFFSDRKLSEQERTHYQLELNSFRINYQQAALSEPDRLRAAGANRQQVEAAQNRRDLLVGAYPQSSGRLRESRDAAAQFSLPQADIRFLESGVHMKYGQEQQALLAFADATAYLGKAANAPLEQSSPILQHGKAVADQISEQEPLLTQPIKKLLWENVPKPPCSKQKPQETLSASRF